ncbi:hypothetical protein MTR_6g452650 [Medicago truncatula]|uniref:Uncharacterized protein n=1 Tax=Medicago truncatula TaxID=3880 RepID=A0A072U9H9_MEDTR|nr:hypothetical protein MTR_6g452650 [Medicago truncatula]
MGDELTSQYKHSANFLGDDTIVNKTGRRRWTNLIVGSLFQPLVILSSFKLGFQQNSYCRDFDLHEKYDLHVVYLREGGGLPLLKCVLKHDIRAKRMVAPRASLSLTAMMPQHVRDHVGSLFILIFFSFGYRELKVGRESMVIVFNGFINA